MEDGDTEKYHLSSMIQDFVFLSRKSGCIRCISLQIYNKANYRLMKVKSIAECSNGEHSAILSTFIKLLFVIRIFVLSFFEWLLKMCFTIQ